MSKFAIFLKLWRAITVVSIMKAIQLLVISCVALPLAPQALAQKQHAFIWNAGTGMTDLGTLGGASSFELRAWRQ
jgi:hypothetical protein